MQDTRRVAVPHRCLGGRASGQRTHTQLSFKNIRLSLSARKRRQPGEPLIQVSRLVHWEFFVHRTKLGVRQEQRCPWLSCGWLAQEIPPAGQVVKVVAPKEIICA